MSQTAKVLLLYAHPESQDSVANRVLLKPATQLSNVTVHDLYAHYPDFYRYSLRAGTAASARRDCVPASALYIQLSGIAERVAGPRAEPGLLQRGGGNQLAGKYWRSVITTGEPESAYRHDGLNRYPMSDILRPFELTAAMCRMHWMSPIIIYWARRQDPKALASHAGPMANGWRHRFRREDANGRFEFTPCRGAVLFAAVVAVPLAARLGIGAVLGYLLAGIAIGLGAWVYQRCG